MKNLLNLFFPKVCLGCNGFLGDHQAYLCLSCRHELPVTNFHFNNSTAVKEVLYGRVQLELATALLHFSKKGIVQQLMHNLKYRGQESVGVFLGEWLGAELRSLEAYKSVEVVVPVPLHRSKLKKRGYNQVAKFGKAIANALKVPYNDKVLVKTTNTHTQVFKDRLRRILNNEAVFALKEPQSFKGKHVLLVDDIITTGATIEACSRVLSQTPGIKLSVALMAITD